MSNQNNNKGMNIGLWVAQVLVALTLIWGAYAKLMMPAEELAAMMPWTADSPSLATLTGVVDLLGGLGLILPALLKIQPKLTIYAAYGTMLLMVAGSIFHGSRGEFPLIGMNLFILALAYFIAWGRTKKAPIYAKGSARLA
ncbi:MAG: DoxX family protein [Saprospiraceae bacterium]